jgi:hypothetical protein
MINILPESGRRVAVREYFLRLAAAACALVGMVALCTALMLVPSYLFASVARDNAQATHPASVDAGVEKGDSALLVRSEREADMLFTFLSAPKESESLAKIIAAAGEDVTLSRLSLSGKGAVMQVSGKAATRDALLAFSRRLKSLPQVGSADVPISDLVKNTDVPFSVTITFTH